MKKKKEPFIENTIETIGLAKKFIQLVNPLFNQVLDENWKYVFYFYLKPNKLFGQLNMLLIKNPLRACECIIVGKL